MTYWIAVLPQIQNHLYATCALCCLGAFFCLFYVFYPDLPEPQVKKAKKLVIVLLISASITGWIATFIPAEKGDLKSILEVHNANPNP